jgi:hypothetical protein
MGGIGIAVGTTGVAVGGKAVMVVEAVGEAICTMVGDSVGEALAAILVSWATAVEPEDRVEPASMVCATRVGIDWVATG